MAEETCVKTEVRERTRYCTVILQQNLHQYQEQPVTLIATLKIEDSHFHEIL